jgi:streptomycin 6-kinase
MITVPEELAAWRIRFDGDAGRAWIESLPALVERLVRQWGLVVDDAEPPHSVAGLVMFVHRGGQPLVLKVSWPEDTTAGEALALRAWQGRGAVRLVAAEPESSVLLMERLDHTRSLAALPIGEAAEIAGALIRTLAVPAPAGLQRLSDVAAGIHRGLPGRQRALGDPVPARWVAAATRWAGELGTMGEQALLHADLHYGNVLAGPDGQWLAVDPRPLVGAPEYSVPEMMWNRADELTSGADLRRLLDVIVAAGELDRLLAYRWVVTRCVDYWLWGLAHGLTIDPARCRRILGELGIPGESGVLGELEGRGELVRPRAYDPGPAVGVVGEDVGQGQAAGQVEGRLDEGP